MSRPAQGATRGPASARAVACDLLGEVLEKGRPLDEALAGDRALARLSSRDRAFARLLVATVLRRLGQIDALIDRALDRPLKPGLGRVRNILRIGLAQLLFLGTAPHAAVDATVDLAAGRRLSGYRGLINALLRRLARDGPALIAQQDAPRLNTPDWLWQSWCEAYGAEATRAIAAVHQEEPPLDITLRPGEAVARWAERLGAVRLPGDSLRLASGHGPIERLAGFDDGAWWVQDAAAALPPRLLGDLAGRRVVDLCAAPGGKTAWLAASGARVTAVDRSDARMEVLRANLARLGLEAETVVADAVRWRPERPVDLVLLDAPCSGTGTLRRHPDIARLKSPGDVAALAVEQDRLLRAAVEICAPGGTIVYAVCSLQPEEGPGAIDRFLEGGGPVEVRLLGAADLPGCVWTGPPLITDRGDLRSLPSHLVEGGGVDGFYACRLRRL